MVMNNYNEMTPAQKAMMRERIVKEASKLTGEERKKYIESLKAKGISPSTIGFGTNKNKTLNESLGLKSGGAVKKKVPLKKKR
jgi:hypothetical protein